MKKVGFVVFGLELEKYLSDTYRPRIVLYSLLDSSNNTLIPVVDQTLKNHKGLDVTIRYSQHSDLYLGACKGLHQQSNLSFSETQSTQEIIEAILIYIDLNLLGSPYFSCLAVMQLSRTLDDQSLKEKYFNQALEKLKRVPEDIIEIQTNGLNHFIERIRNQSKDELVAEVTKCVEKYKLTSIL